MDVVAAVAELLRTRYVFPDRGRAAAAELEARETAGAYAGLDDEQLSARLTADLDELCHDRHLRVRVRPPDVHDATSEEDWEAAWREQQRTTNYGVAKVERLPGNIGLIDLRVVTDPAIGGGAIAAAMALGPTPRHSSSICAATAGVAAGSGDVVQLLLPRRRDTPQRHP